MIKIIPPPRGFDAHGSGAFNAPRGDHTHNGVDFACVARSKILSVCAGEVTKIGYPYNPTDSKKGHLRYVQVTDIDGRDLRYFYVRPIVKVGDKVSTDDVLGTSQDLTSIYKGIVQHFHFEIRDNGKYLNPDEYLSED